MICVPCTRQQHDQCLYGHDCSCAHKVPEKKDEETTQEAGSD